MIAWQAFCAALNCGELGSRPLLESSVSRAPPPEKVGSGNFGTPCERMHAENASACACIFACCAGLGGLICSRRWHACCAALKVAEFGSIPVLGLIVRLPPLPGSGKLCTPC